MALTVAISSIIFASCTNSSTVAPEIDNILGKSGNFSASSGKKSAVTASIPGLAKPTEFKIPALVFTIQGCGFPVRGVNVVVFNTKAPN